MVTLTFANKHNMVAYLEKAEDDTKYHQIIDFLNASHIRYSLTLNPTIYVPQIKEFWQSSTVKTFEDGHTELVATVDGKCITLTESSIRRHLRLGDSNGISSMPNTEIFENLTKMGYNIESEALTFQKGAFAPQWRFLIHTILHCLSPKKTSWEQFSSNIATALICLATNRTFNFSKLIFQAMLKNVYIKSKFLMYPRFIQSILNKSKHQLLHHKNVYPTPKLSQKVFSNMKMSSKWYNEEEVPLFDSMLQVDGEGSSCQVAPHHTLDRSVSREGSVVPQHQDPVTLHVADESGVVIKKRDASTVASLENGQDKTNVHNKESVTTPPVPSSCEPSTIGGIASRRDIFVGSGSQHMVDHESVSHDAPVYEGNTSGSIEGSQTLKELMETCTNLSQKVTALESDLNSKDSKMEAVEAELTSHKKLFSNVYTKLVRKIKNLEKQVKTLKRKGSANMVSSFESSSSASSLDGEGAGKDVGSSKHGGKIAQIDQNPSVFIVQEQYETQERQEHQMDYDTADFDGSTGGFGDGDDETEHDAGVVEGAAILHSLMDAGYKGSASAFYTRTPRKSNAYKGKGIMAEQEPSRKLSTKERAPIELDDYLVQNGNQINIDEESINRRNGVDSTKLKVQDVCMESGAVDAFEIKRVEKGKASMTVDEPEQEPEKKNEVNPKTHVQIDLDEQLAMKASGNEVASSTGNPKLQVKRVSSDTIVTEQDKIQQLIDSDMVVRKKSIELLADERIADGKKSDMLEDFINLKSYAESYNQITQTIGKNKGQKRNKNPTKEQVIREMKTYVMNEAGLTAVQLKGKSDLEIQSLYYNAYKTVRTKIPMDQHERSPKRLKAAKKAQHVNVDTSTERVKVSQEKMSKMLAKVPEILHVEPLQSRHPIIDWDIYMDRFGSAWKVTRFGGETAVYKNFDNLLRAFDREDLDALWRLVQNKLKTKKKCDAKEQELWVELKRLYEPDPSDDRWYFPFFELSTVWEFYGTCNVHRLSAQDGIDIFMLAELEYPLSYEVLAMMISLQLKYEENSEVVQNLIHRIYDQFERKRHDA